MFLFVWQHAYLANHSIPFDQMMREDEALSVVEVASFLEFLSPSLVVSVCGFVLAFSSFSFSKNKSRQQPGGAKILYLFYSNSVKDLFLDQLFSSIFRKSRISRYMAFQVGKRNLRRAVFMKKKESYIFPSFFFTFKHYDLYREV